MDCGIRCALIAPPSGSAWLAEWWTRQRVGRGIQADVLVDRSDADLAQVLQGDQAAPFEAILMLVASGGLEWARRRLSAMGPCRVPVIAVARGLRTDSIRSLLRLGVRDFVADDCGGEELEVRLWRLRQMVRPSPQTDSAEGRHPLLCRLIGSSPAFVAQIERIPVIGACDAGVLILGETGTGKELCARAIHELSKRASAPWVPVNCGALPAELIENELFGHARGAFTSANEARVGLIGEADGGTLFLDEVDSLPPAAQAKLLRFLQEKEFRQVGDARPRRANVRVVAATNGDPAALVEQGRLRLDLYHRLNVLSLRLPPLRERPEDLMPLTDHFLLRYAAEFGRPVHGLTRAALARLAAYCWPGNVRELEHAIERAVLFCRGEFIDVADLELLDDADVPTAPQTFQAAKRRVVDAFERSYIEHLLLTCGGNITHAAEAAGKNRRAFWQLVRKHGVDAGRYRVSD